VLILKSKTNLIFGLIFATLGVLAWISFYEIRRLVVNDRWVAHTHEVLEQSAGVREHLGRAVAARRGFVLYGDESIAGQFEKDSREVLERLGALRNLTTDDSDEQERLGGIESLVRRRLSLMRESIELRRKKGLDEEAQRKYREQSQTMGERIDEEWYQFEDRGKKLLIQRVDEASRSVQVSNRLNVAVVLGTFAALLLALWLQNREEEARRRAERALAGSENLVESVFNSMSDEVLIADTSGRVILRNPAAAERHPEPARKGPPPEEHAAYYGLYRADGKTLMSKEELPLVRACHGETVDNVELYIHTPGKKSGRWVLASGRPLRDADGMLQGGVVVLRDFTRRKKAQDELEASQRRLTEAQRIARMGNWDWNAVNGELHWSEETYRILGFRPGEIVPTFEEFLKLVVPGDREELQKQVEEALEGRKPYDIQFRIQRRDGTELALHARGEVERDESGRAVRMSGSMQDITERKESERREKVRREQWRRLSELSLTMSGDPADIFEHVARMIGELFHVRVVCLSEVSGKDLIFRAVYAGGKTFRDAGQCPLAITPCANVERDKDIRVFDYVAEKFPEASFLREHNAFSYCGFPAMGSDGEVLAITCLLDDKAHEFTEEDRKLLRILGQRIATEVERSQGIAQRRKAEEALRESEQLFRELGTNLPELLWVREASLSSGVLLYANPAWERLLGHKPPVGSDFRQLFKVVHPEDLEIVRQATADNVSGSFDKVVRLKGSRGQVRWFQMRAFPILDEKGNIYRVAGIGEDITEQRKVEEALRLSEERYALVERGVNDGIWDWNVVTHEDYLSPRWKNILGYRDEELVNTDVTFFGLIHPADKAAVEEAVRRHFEEGRAFHIEFRLRHKNGSYRWVLSRGEALRDATGRPVRMTGTITDCTERHEAEERLAASLREKEILLREVHHRVKNNLQIISSLLYFQSKKMKNPEDITVFQEGQDRLRSMIMVHETLHRSGDLARIDFGEHVRALAAALRQSNTISQGKIDIDVDAGEIALAMEVALPCGMIVNELLTNAYKHAFPEGRGGLIRVKARRDGDVLKISVTDTGVGLPQELDAGKSASFGMQLIRGLLVQLNGTMEIRSSRGTSVLLDIPMPVRAAEAKELAPPAERRSHAGDHSGF
jgi:PAS domain S-box-containing protein